MAATSLSQKKEGTKDQDDYQRACMKFNEIVPNLPREGGWWFEHLALFQGFWLTIHVGLKGLILLHEHMFKPQSTDIILATSPKSGTTWVRALIFAIMNRTVYDFANHPLLTTNPKDLVPFLELLLSRDELYPRLQSPPSPRLLSTHLAYTLFPQSFPESGCRFVYVCRDPKDVLVSKWHFMRRVRPKHLPPISFQEAFEMFCKGVSHNGPFWDHVLSYWKASLQWPEKVLFLRYEDLHREPKVCVRKLAEFLGLPFSSEEEDEGVVQEIVRLCSFDNMSNLEVNKFEDSKRPVKNPDFFRSGQVGDWKNHLTPEMADRISKITEKKLHGSGLNLTSTS